MTVEAEVNSVGKRDVGAVAGLDGIDAGLPWHYGDPFGEQRALARTAGVVDRSNRDVLTVSGPDRLLWLHSIISQHVSELADGQATESLVLSPHGHVEQHWQLAQVDETVWLDVEPGMGEDALKYLTMMRFLKRVELADVSDEWAVLTVAGPSTPAVLTAVELPSPEVGHVLGIAGGGFVRGMPAGPLDTTHAVDVVVARDRVDELIERLVAVGAQRAGSWAYDALRVQARRPRLRFETDHRTIAHEVGWIGSAVHLDKGCYRGQETVARVQNLGKPPRRLVMIHFDGSTDVLPVPGTPVEHMGRGIGFVGTSVQHYELGPIALAVIKRSLDDDADLRVAGQPVTINPGPRAES